MRIKKFFRYLFLILAVSGLLATGIRLFTLVRGPSEVRRMRKEEIVQKEEGYLEYYFNLLTEEEKRGYRELLDGVRKEREVLPDYFRRQSGGPCLSCSSERPS